MAEWQYCGITNERLAMYYCPECMKMFISQNPDRRIYADECPNCHTKLHRPEMNIRNCYTCCYRKDCEIMESMNEDSRREDSICDSWAERRTIEYVSESGTRGILYNWHKDDYSGKKYYSMSIRDKDGYEILHAYNAAPKTKAQLKEIVDHQIGTYFIRQMAKEYENEEK